MAGPWLAYADRVGREPVPPCGRVTKPPGEAQGLALVSSCQPRIFSNWSLKADAPTQSGAWEPLGSAVPRLLCNQLVWF